MSDNEKRDTSTFEIAMAVIGVVGAIAGLFSGMGSGPEMKTMKAPGKDGRIFRKSFESDPKGYFQNLRKKWMFDDVMYVGLVLPISTIWWNNKNNDNNR